MSNPDLRGKNEPTKTTQTSWKPLGWLLLFAVVGFVLLLGFFLLLGNMGLIEDKHGHGLPIGPTPLGAVVFPIIGAVGYFIWWLNSRRKR